MNFDKYPEIKKAYKKYNSLQNKLANIQNKIEVANANNDSSLQKEFRAVFNEIEDYIDVFAKIIYDSLSKLRPSLYNIRTKTISTWDEIVINKDEFLKDKNNCRLLVGLITGVGLYRIK